MKILFISDAPETPNAGAAGTEFQTIEALRGLGHDVDALWADALPHRISHGNLHYLLELPIAYKNRMIERIRSAHYDVVHVTESHGYLAAKSLRKSGRKSILVHRSHGLEMRAQLELAQWKRECLRNDAGYLRRLMRWAMSHAMTLPSRKIADHADGHIVSASQCGEFLHEQMRVPIERIAVIPQAAPDSFLNQPAPPMTAARLQNILYVGQFAFVKAPMMLARVIERLSGVDPNLRFTWVCSRKHHAQVRELLAPTARERTNLLDWMPQDQLLRVYDRHGLFLLPSFFEGFGKVFLEAMSRGLCVVATDNGGAHDVITSDVDGMLAPTGSIEAMVDCSLRLISDLETAIRVSTAAARTARSYSWERVAKETVSFYEDRLSARARELAAAR